LNSNIELDSNIEQNSTQLRILTFSQSLVSHKLAANEVMSKTKLNFVAIFETISVALYQPGALNVCRQAPMNY
jgi:hypothetical protein